MSGDETKKKVDEEWKKKAREEAEKAEAQAEAAPAAGEPEGEEAMPPLEASFQMLITSFASEALISLGAVENPYTRRRERNLDHAKYAIDMLQLIAEKTKGNLSDDEKKYLDGTLFDLRMRYLGG